MSAATTSPNAYALYRKILAEWNAKPLRLCDDIDLTDAELRWWSLTPLESRVFCIDPALYNALLLAYIRYMDMIGISTAEFYPVAAEDRAAYPECYLGEAVFSFEAAVGFMVAACEMPQEPSMAVVARALVQNVRSHLYPQMEVPSWAVGAVDPNGE